MSVGWRVRPECSEARGDQCRQVITGLNQGKIGERKELNEWRDRNSHQQPLP